MTVASQLTRLSLLQNANMSTTRKKYFSYDTDMKNWQLSLRQLVSEFLGSFLYLALVLSAGVGNEKEGSAVDPGDCVLLKAFANGLLVASIVAIFGHVSGGHINPAVTCGALICGHIRPIKAIFYVVVQIAGSVVGAGVAYLLSSETIRGNLGATIPYKNIRSDQAVGSEFLMTFILVSVVLSVVDSTRGARGLGSAPLAVGVAITASICACSPYTISMNPIRSFGPAVIMGIWTQHWVYWVGPISGGLVAGVFYRFVLKYYRRNMIVLQSSRGDLRNEPDARRSSHE